MDHVLWYTGYRLLIPNIVKSEGCYLFDHQGRQYVDMESGVWCTPLGHSHPQINHVIKTQIDKIIHTGFCYSNSIVEEASIGILNIVGLSDGKCVFLSSGSEAVECGVQAVREITEKSRLLTLYDSYLGSYGSAGKRSEDEWYLFDWTACSSCPVSDECNPHCKYLSDIPFGEIGGFVFEPGSSSGLVRFPPKSLIQNITDSIKDHGGLIQINEITTGIGRTGEWFGFQHYDIHPDLVSMGKGLGNGYPVSVTAMSPTVIDLLNRTSFHHSQSHQNDPLGCAVATAVINILKEESLVEKGRLLGEYFLGELLQLKAKHSLIEEVRGRGLMIAVEFVESIENDVIKNLYQQCVQRGFIIAQRPGLNVFRLDPPLTIKKETVDDFLKYFDQALSDMG